jgi:hypothetical protein
VFQDIPRFHKSIQKCDENAKFAFANFLTFPDKITKEFWNSLTHPDEHMKIDLYFTNANFLIGGYMAEILDGYQIIHLQKITLNPKLKAKSYTREMMNDLSDFGLQLFGENFKGIVSTSQCTYKKKSLDKNNKIKIQAMINSGGKIVVECARIKSQILHFLYIPFNGGLDQSEVKEIFKKVTQNIQF